MKTIRIVVFVLLCITSLSFPPAVWADTKGNNVIEGAVVGAVINCVHSKSCNGEDIGKGVLVGGLVGWFLDQTTAELQKEIGSDEVHVIREGNHVKVSIEGSVLFAFDSDEISREARNTIKKLAEKVKQLGGKVQKFLVVGHTDKTGPPLYNHELSWDRARAAAQAIVANGVSLEIVYVDGRGEKELICTLENEPTISKQVCDQRNRRVEFLFFIEL